MSALSPPAETKMPEGPWLLVVGMHRSGTSALTGALGRLGIAVPATADRWETYGRAQGNPEHWESRALGLLDERLLERLESTWDGPPDPDALAAFDLHNAFAEVGNPAEAASVAFPFAGPVTWKDPRSCLLLPYWLAHLPKPVTAVFIWRSPLSVARSLQARDGMELADGVALWERYNRSGLAGLLGIDTYVVKYESLVADSSTVLGAVAAWLGQLPQFASHSLAWDVRGAAATVSPLLRHQNASEPSQLLLTEQAQLKNHLEELNGPHRPLNSPPPGRESPWTTASLRVRRQAASCQRQIQSLHLLAQEKEGAAEALSVDLHRSETELARMNELLEGMRASASWRVTRPLRRAFAFRVRRGGKSIA